MLTLFVLCTASRPVWIGGGYCWRRRHAEQQRPGKTLQFRSYLFWCLFGTFTTMSALAFARWQEDYELFFLGALFVRVCVARPQHFATSLAPTAPPTSDVYGCVLHFDDYGVLCR
jgi:hypothetical protein